MEGDGNLGDRMESAYSFSDWLLDEGCTTDGPGSSKSDDVQHGWFLENKKV